MSNRFYSTSRPAALAVLVLSMASIPASADPQGSVHIFNCYGTRGAASCIVTHRRGPLNPHVIGMPARSEEEAAAAEARDRRWAERCEPVVRQDRYGMPRYSYGAQGCEYGRLD